MAWVPCTSRNPKPLPLQADTRRKTPSNGWTTAQQTSPRRIITSLTGTTTRLRHPRIHARNLLGLNPFKEESARLKKIETHVSEARLAYLRRQGSGYELLSCFPLLKNPKVIYAPAPQALSILMNWQSLREGFSSFQKPRSTASLRSLVKACVPFQGDTSPQTMWVYELLV